MGELTRWGRSAAVICALAAMTTSTALAQDEGTVQIPLSTWQALSHPPERAASAGHAFGPAQLDVRVESEGEALVAVVTVEASVRVLEDAWTFVPLDSGGAPILSFTADGEAAELVARGGGASWPSNAPGTHALSWSYRVDVQRRGDRRVLAIGAPPVTGRLTATIPGEHGDLTALGASGASVHADAGGTRLDATIAGGVQLSWADRAASGVTVSRARYVGRLDGDVVRFEAELAVELASDAPARVRLFPAAVALEDVLVDRAEAAIAAEDGAFVIPIAGRGRHRVRASFQVPVVVDDGLPRVDLAVLETPVSRFELSLPGDRDVHVTPHAGVTATRRDGRTVATFHVPMSSTLSIRWSEAVPDDAEAVEARAHATLVHVARPDDGVLSMRAFATWEITRGALSRVHLALPDGVQVNAVETSSGVVSDWRVGDGAPRVVDVFLDRAVEGELALEVSYERAWPVRTRASEPIELPLLRAADVHRQRGMVALVATRELTLEPRDEERVSRVGENLLPAAVRESIDATVAHTYRYLDEPARLTAVGAARAPEPARFDAQVDTLISLGDVSTTITALVDVEVKSGTLDAITMRVPEDLALLEVSAPSLRRHAWVEEDGERALRVEMTQPMEGRFRVEIVCERVGEADDALEVPLVGVRGADVERGRLALEALGPFSVEPAAVERLSPLDPSALPESLLLRTDNPILHAYRYAQAAPPPRLALSITRHAEVTTPRAAIEAARYDTEYTREGTAVTTARWSVRNRRQQFLRVRLPEGSRVWSARVDGRPQTPALAADADEDAPEVLVEIVSAAEAFEVELVYATPADAVGAFGRIGGSLPAVDVAVARTEWTVFLPEGPRYGSPSSSLAVTSGGDVARGGADGAAEGVRYVFAGRYADGAASFSIPYAEGWGRPATIGASVLGALLVCLALLALAVLRLGLPVPPAVAEQLASYRGHEDVEAPPPPLPRGVAPALIGVGVLGVVLLGVTIGYLATTVWAALGVGVIVAVGAAGMGVRARRAVSVAA